MIHTPETLILPSLEREEVPHNLMRELKNKHWTLLRRAQGVLYKEEQCIRKNEVEITFIRPSDFGFRKNVSFEQIYFKVEREGFVYFPKKYIFDLCIREDFLKNYKNLIIGIKPEQDHQGFESILKIDQLPQEKYISTLRTYSKLGISVNEKILFEKK